MSRSDLETNDTDWIRQSFMVSEDAIDDRLRYRRIMTTAIYKFTDTTIGGNFAINPPPQFTEYSDIRVPSRNTGSTGMGRYYSEVMDDNGTLVHMRFGVPKFNSLTNFFFNFYNPQASHIAHTGRSRGVFYTAGKALGFVVTLPFQPFIWFGAAVRFFVGKPVSKYYYMKPVMPMYWSAVTSMVNGIGVNMGIVPRRLPKSRQALRGGDENYTEEDVSAYHDLMPNLYKKGGGIDVMAVATRAQRLAMRDMEQKQQIMDQVDGVSTLSEAFENYHTLTVSDEEPPNIEDYLKTWTETPEARPNLDEANNGDTEGTGPTGGFFSDMVEHFTAAAQDGNDWVTFRVDNPGTVSESFSNTVGESELASKLNGMSSANRTKRFMFADGNLGDGAVANVVEGVVGAAKDAVSGILEGLSVGGLAAFGGSAFADIPKVWQESIANLPTTSFTMELRSPYGNKMSRFQNLILPLSMILAGTLPLATGKQSYTSPFLCELYVKGHSQVRLGMITELEITRGAGNVGWTKDHEPLGIDVTFTVTDMSSVMSMPISPNWEGPGVGDAGMLALAEGGEDLGAAIGRDVGNLADALGGSINDAEGRGADIGQAIAASIAKSTFDDDNAYTDYLAVLGSLSMMDQVNPLNRLKLRVNRNMQRWERWLSPAEHANWMSGTITGSALKLFSTQGARGQL